MTIAGPRPHPLLAAYPVYAPRVRRMLGHMLGDASLADDGTQETFVRAATADFDATQGDIGPFLFGIARNVAREFSRRRRRTEVRAEAELELLVLGVHAGWGQESPETHLSQAERRDALARSLAALCEDHREVLVLRDIEGLSNEAVAALVGESLAATKSRVHRARLSLLAELKRSEGGVVANERMAGGMSCREVLAVLGAFVDGELGPTDVARVRTHLVACSVCERFGARFANTVAAIREDLGAEPALDPAVFAALSAKLR
jgi:RNA polymerase sigma-70 factor, ECF subfamily